MCSRWSVAHGHNQRVSFADLTDLNFALAPLDQSLFPGVSTTVEVHSGFAAEQAMYVACATHISFSILHRVLTKI
jgi:hypothetical protein